MSESRKPISLTKKLAAALLTIGDIPYDDAKQMTAAQIISLYQFDHGVLHGVEVIDEPWNLTPRLIAPHRKKSRTDTGIVAKVKRIEREHVAFRERMLTREAKPPPKYKWPKRKLRSRGFR
jgi:hypothetical protein